MIKGKITEIFIRETDLVISYTDEQFPDAAGYQVSILKEELISFPYGESIVVNTVENGTVTTVRVNGQLILDRT